MADAAETGLSTEHVRKTLADANRSLPGSREALKALVAGPCGALLAEGYGDAARNAEERVIGYVSGGNVLVDETTRRWIADVRADLAEPGDTELEAMLVYRVSLCWLAVNAAEQLRAEKWEGGIGTEQADFWDRHVSRVQSDFLKACRALATVRKLRRPVLQMNIAEKQINVVR